jgi:hypothetical protein
MKNIGLHWFYSNSLLSGFVVETARYGCYFGSIVIATACSAALLLRLLAMDATSAP